MLHLILSRVSGGKTTHIINLIKDFSENESNKITLIVPEQFTYTCERNMLSLMGAKKMAGIDVLSFTALGEKIMGRPALFDRRRLSDSSAAVLMGMSVSEVKDKLQLYGKHAERKSVIKEFVSLSTEMKRNLISPDALKTAAGQMDNSLLKAKLNDISLILENYDKKVSESFFNPDDLLTDLAKIAGLDEYFNNRLVFVDSFNGFTAQEYEIIAHILRNSKAAYFTLCTDTIDKEPDITDLFATTKATANRLIRIAKENNIQVTKTDFLSGVSKYNNFPPDFVKYKCPELIALERMLYSPVAEKYEEECDNITLCTASDIYSECEYVAATAKKLIREQKYRCREIAVMARNIAQYERPLKSALAKCGISTFEDTRKPLASSPVIILITALLKIAAKGFDTENIMRLLKTGLTSLDSREISELENYCYLWQLNGKRWAENWTRSPSGFGIKTEKDEEVLSSINKSRSMIIEPIVKLRSKLKGGVSGEEAMKAVWNYIAETDVQSNLKRKARELNGAGETGAVIELERTWNFMINLLDEAETLVRNKKVTAEKLYNIFDLMLSCETSGSLPHGLDEIIIGSADRSRTSSPKVVFIVGANEGVFPADAPGKSSLTDKERALMEKYGIVLSSTGEKKLAEEKFIAYNTVCSATEKLYVCCSSRNSAGEELMPGEFFNRIKSIFVNVRTVDTSELDSMYFVEGNQPAFEQLAKSKESDFKTTLSEYFKSNKEYSGKLAALERAENRRNFKIKDTAVAESLFGKNMLFSASRIEQYYKCGFSYFCKYGIKAVPRKIAELDPLQKGNIIHATMQHILSAYKPEKLSEMNNEEIFGIVSVFMDDYLVNILFIENEDNRFLNTYQKLKETITQVVLRLIEEFEQSEFVPIEFEMPIGTKEEIKPYTISNDNGTVGIAGTIDRVDTAVINGKKYFRVIDYKSSGKEFRLSNVIQGLNMQMLIYLFALWQNGRHKFGQESTPAGILYYNAASPYVSASPDDTEEKIKQTLYGRVKSSGMILRSGEVLTAMEKDGIGRFLPAKFDKDGNVIGDTYNLNELLLLKEKCDSLILEMSDLLKSGNIDAYPVCSDSKSYSKICDYCDFKTICSYEPDIPVKKLFKTDNTEVMKMLSSGGEADEMDSRSAESH